MTLSQTDVSYILLNQHCDDDELIARVMKYCNQKYPNEGTRAYKISLMKKKVQELELLDDQKKCILISDCDLYKRVILDQKSKIKTDKRVISRKLIETIKEGRHSKNKLHLFFYLLLCSGLRGSECLNGEFYLLDKETITIKELTKKRGLPPPVNGYQLNLLYETPESFILLLDNLNELRTKGDGSMVLSKTMMCKSAAFMRNLSDGKLKVRDLRSLYIVLQKEKPENKLKRSAALIKELLHHEDHSVSIRYNDCFEIVD